MRRPVVRMLAVATVLAAGCGGSQDDRRTATAPAAGNNRSLQQIVAEQRDAEIDRVNAQLERAARATSRSDVARLERTLDALARNEADLERDGPRSDTAFGRALDTFAFKQAPLYAQQLVSVVKEHRASAAVFREHFCLKTPDTRKQAAATVYRQLDGLMRAAGITDFEFVVVALRQTAQHTAANALAIGRNGRLRLTKRGRTC